MAFKPGDKKPKNSGRKKGVTNKATPLKKAKAILEEAGINPYEEAIKVVAKLSPRDQFNAWVELHSWTATKPKAEPAEQAESVETPIVEDEKSVEELMKLVR